MGNAHAESDQISRTRLCIRAGKHKIELTLEHVEIFVLIRADMGWHEGAWREGRVPVEAVSGAVFGHIWLLKDVPRRALHSLVRPGNPPVLAIHGCAFPFYLHSLPSRRYSA